MWKIILNRSVEHRFPIIIGVFIILFNFFPLLMGQSMLFGDNFSLMVPGKLFSASWIAKGIIPLWNPTQFAGLSWVGDINQSLFYPSTLLFILFRPNVALNLALLSHLLLSFIGAFFLAREVSPKLSKFSWLLAAVFWSFAPQVIGALNNLATLQSLSYLPGIVLGCLHFNQKKAGSWWYLPVLICLQLLGGYPQHVFFSVMFGVIFSAMIHRIVLSRWLFVGLLSFLLSAWIWLPFLQNLNQSTRSLQTTEQAQTGSLHIDDLVKIVSPVFFDNPSMGYKWGPGWNRPSIPLLYFTWIGIAALTVGIVRNKKEKIDVFLLGTLLICILVAFGDATPLYSILQMIPVLASSRGASTILVIATLAGSLLFSRAIFNLKISLTNQKKYFSVVILLGLAMGVLWLLSQIYFEQIWAFINAISRGVLENSAFHTLEKDRILVTSILFSLCIQSFILLFSSWFLVQGRRLLLVLIIASDLLFFANQYYFFGPSNAYDAPKSTEIAAHVGKKMGNNFRLLTRNYNAPYADFGAYAEALIVRQPFSDSFVDAQELTNFSVALKMKELLTPGWNTPVNIPTINGYTTLLPASISKDFG
ncbi:hypothetical protein KBC89_01920, partial [Candidatus Woesebacteria bacterium]|nr:hypothetical protein [Candidatus Woesebacteria bacterium]